MSGSSAPAEWMTITVQEDKENLVFILQKYSLENPVINIRRHPRPLDWPNGLQAVRMRFRASWTPVPRSYWYRDMQFQQLKIVEPLIVPAHLRVYHGETLLSQNRITEGQMQTCVRDITIWALKSVQDELFTQPPYPLSG